MRCIEHTMVIAGILNLTLVVKMTPRKYDRAKIDCRLLFDIAHMRQCFGKESILTSEEYVAKFNEPLIIDRVKCWENFPRGCGIDRGHFSAANSEIIIPASKPTELVYNNKNEATTHHAFCVNMATMTRGQSRLDRHFSWALYIVKTRSGTTCFTPQMFLSHVNPFVKTGWHFSLTPHC